MFAVQEEKPLYAKERALKWLWNTTGNKPFRKMTGGKRKTEAETYKDRLLFRSLVSPPLYFKLESINF